MTNWIKNENYPFIKNQYYAGKLLHAGDFTNEQEYFNHKYQYHNQILAGDGILYGLQVQQTESGAIRLQNGVCMDSFGRLVIVPRQMTVRASELSGCQADMPERMILGIEYAEKIKDVEFSALTESDDKYRASRKEETYSLGLYTTQEWQQASYTKEASGLAFTVNTLYEDEHIRFIQQVPQIVPAGQHFTMNIAAEPVDGGRVSVRYSILLRMQGGIFLRSGKHHLLIEGEAQVQGAGKILHKIVIQAHSESAVPLYLESSVQMIRKDSIDIECKNSCSVSIRSTDKYEEDIRNFMREAIVREEADQGTSDNNNLRPWVALAVLTFSEQEEGKTDKSDRRIRSIDAEHIRQYAANPLLENQIRLIKEKSGIAYSESTPPVYPPAPEPPHPPQPPHPPHPPFPIDPPITKEQAEELIKQKRDANIRRGVAVVKIPHRYRSGRVLYTDEIFHGFKEEEVVIWYGRLWETKNYAFWEPDAKHHRITAGQESLFAAKEDTGWQVQNHALRLNYEEGTFQIAVTLKRHRRKGKETELAISWVAVKTT